MMGESDPQRSMFDNLSLEVFVPEEHPLRRIRPLIDDAVMARAAAIPATKAASGARGELARRLGAQPQAAGPRPRATGDGMIATRSAAVDRVDRNRAGRQGHPAGAAHHKARKGPRTTGSVSNLLGGARGANQMLERPRLTYFDMRGRGEAIRLLLHATRTEFEDNRIVSRADWAVLKPMLPFGVLPIYESNGIHLAESHAILRQNESNLAEHLTSSTG
jgi:hypothetical protein